MATRAGGHFATLYTHIDDLTESLRVVTPAGVSESRRLPGSGAGPSPDRLFVGSEGALGVITEAWMRLQNRPQWQVTASVAFNDWPAAVAATRTIAQAGLYPANCRLLDPAEAFLNAGSAVGGGLLVLAFESADHPIDPWLDRAVEISQYSEKRKKFAAANGKLKKGMGIAAFLHGAGFTGSGERYLNSVVGVEGLADGTARVLVSTIQKIVMSKA